MVKELQLHSFLRHFSSQRLLHDFFGQKKLLQSTHIKSHKYVSEEEAIHETRIKFGSLLYLW